MARKTLPELPDKTCEHCKRSFNRYAHPITGRVTEARERFETRRFCSKVCCNAALRAAMDERTKRINDNRKANNYGRTPVTNYDDDDPTDYRHSPEAQQLLTEIEKIVIEKKAVTTRFINDRFTAPRGWSLWDLITVSTKIQIDVDNPRPKVIARETRIGIPAADNFEVSHRTEDKTVANLGLS